MIGDELFDTSRQFRQAALHACSLLGAEPMKRLGHEIAANPQAGQAAFDSLDDCRRVTPDLVKLLADMHDLGMKLPGTGHIAGAGGFAESDVELGEEVGASGDTTVSAGEDSFLKQFFRTN